jgi:hypothetical protein
VHFAPCEVHTLLIEAGSKTMRNKQLLAVALSFPLLTMSSVANAGQTYSHWQRTAWAAQQRVPNAYAAYAAPMVAEPYWIVGSRLCTYQGGPKSNTWTCGWYAEQ